jgi:hypothetical protein
MARKTKPQVITQRGLNTVVATMVRDLIRHRAANEKSDPVRRTDGRS